LIIQREIREKAQEWGVHPDTADKDYVLSHFLSAFYKYFGDQVIFKGGTCLRKCYFPDYRFSEDLDFTSIKNDFILRKDDLLSVCKSIREFNDIVFIPDDIQQLLFQDQKKGYQVKIKYWGANHSRNQQPLPPERWLTRIKLEISTDELTLLSPENKKLNHPFTDSLISSSPILCYPLAEIVAEKLRSLVQRSYTAPRDFYDIYQLTNNYSKKDWHFVKSLFLKKMNHKGLIYSGPDQLIEGSSIVTVLNAWKSSIAHQLNRNQNLIPDTVVNSVITRIKDNL